MLFHALSWATFSHLDLRRPDEEHFTSALKHKSEAIRLVNEKLSHWSGPASDALILAITLLMMDGNGPDPPESVFGGFRPVLTYLQWLNITGRILWLSVHKTILIRLVGERGGLTELQTPGLAELIQR